MTGSTYFGPGLFEFLAGLRENNNREWYQANKGRYERDVRAPLQEFVADFGVHLREISPHYVADPRPVGGSVFRIHRDLRFSRAKTPYKTAAAAHFRHKFGREVHGPGFYLHLEPGNVYAGAGIWRPDRSRLARVRDAIVDDPSWWQRVISDDGFREQFRLESDSLKRPPKGFAPDHPLIDDLKRITFVAVRPFSHEDACAPGFIDRFVEACRAAAPFMEFLTLAVGLPW